MSYDGPERRTDTERLAVLEQKVDAVCDDMGELRQEMRDRMTVLDQKLDAALVNKADKTELTEVKASVKDVNNRFWAMLVATAGVAVITLLGLGVFLLQNHLVK